MLGEESRIVELLIFFPISREVGGDVLRFWSRLLAFISIVILYLLSCVECGAQSAAETPSSMVLPAGTSVILHLNESLYKKDATPGYSLEVEVGYDVVLNGQIVIQNGTAVHR